MSSGRKSAKKGSSSRRQASSPQTPADDQNPFFQQMLGMGSPQGQMPMYWAGSPGGVQFSGSPGAQPFGVPSQYASYPTPPQQTPTPTGMPRSAPRLPRDDVYIPTMTLSDGSETVPMTQDPAFSTEEYDGTEPEIAGGSRDKGKAPAGESSAPKPKRPRTTYRPEETALVAHCWADTTQDSVRGTYQTEGAFWERVAAKYNHEKDDDWKEHTFEELRRHWERLLRECALFDGIYKRGLDNMASGHNEYTVREAAFKLFKAQHNGMGFKWWDIYDKLKGLPKFTHGMKRALNTRSRRSTPLVDDSGTGSGAEPINLSGEGPMQRPPGRGRTRANARAGRATGSGSMASDAQTALQQTFTVMADKSTQMNLTQMMAIYFNNTPKTFQEKIMLMTHINELREEVGKPPFPMPTE